MSGDEFEVARFPIRLWSGALRPGFMLCAFAGGGLYVRFVLLGPGPTSPVLRFWRSPIGTSILVGCAVFALAALVNGLVAYRRGQGLELRPHHLALWTGYRNWVIRADELAMITSIEPRTIGGLDERAFTIEIAGSSRSGYVRSSMLAADLEEVRTAIIRAYPDRLDGDGLAVRPGP